MSQSVCEYLADLLAESAMLWLWLWLWSMVLVMALTLAMAIVMAMATAMTMATMATAMSMAAWLIYKYILVSDHKHVWLTEWVSDQPDPREASSSNNNKHNNNKQKNKNHNYSKHNDNLQDNNNTTITFTVKRNNQTNCYLVWACPNLSFLVLSLSRELFRQFFKLNWKILRDIQVRLSNSSNFSTNLWGALQK